MMRLMETRELMFKNRQEKRMPATLRMPQDASRGVMVMLHGLGGWKDQGVIVAAAEAAGLEGYTVLTFDAADGANGPDGAFYRATNTDYLHDLEDVISYVEREEWYREPFILAGHSQGALVALRYAAEYPGVAQRLILIAPAVSWTAAFLAAKGYGLAFLAWLFNWFVTGFANWNGPNGKKLKIGRNWFFDFFKWNGRRYAKRIHVPVLIVTAERDMTVATVEYHTRFARAFSDARHEVVPGAVHDFADHTEKITAIVRAWLTPS